MTKVRSKTWTAVFAAVAVGSAMLLAAAAEARPSGGGGGGFKSGGGGGGASVRSGMTSKPSGPGHSIPGKFGSLKPKPPQCLGIGCTGPHKPPHKHHRHRHWFWGGSTIYAGDHGGCGYEYYKWKSTGSSYWYARYRDCIAS